MAQFRKIFDELILPKFVCATRKRSFFNSSICYKSIITDNLRKLFQKKEPQVTTHGQEPWPGYKFSGPLRPLYPLSGKRLVPQHISRPDYADQSRGIPHGELAAKNHSIEILSSNEIECVRKACKLARECLDIGLKAVKPGVTTDAIDAVVHKAAIDRDCYPSPLNYYNFPKSCCTSVNEVICHGIPDQRELTNGDILKLDVTCYYNGFHGDACETVFIGSVDESSKLLTIKTYECLMAAVNKVQPGLPYFLVGNIIDELASASGYSVTRKYSGHGIHRLFHTAPWVPHFKNSGAQGIMQPGHVFTIEPMINEGVDSCCNWPDGWTVVTADGRRSAQFEHTVLVTETGVDILTLQDKGVPFFQNQTA